MIFLQRGASVEIFHLSQKDTLSSVRNSAVKNQAYLSLFFPILHHVKFDSLRILRDLKKIDRVPHSIFQRI